MVSWAVTGATRGIGFGWVENLSTDQNNQVFAVIRSRSTAGPLEELAARNKNIHILVTDLSDPKRLDTTATEISEITNGSLDILVLNAGSTTDDTAQISPSGFRGKEDLLEKEVNDNLRANLFSNIYTINSFLDLIRNGKEKKIIFTSSQSGSVEFTRITGFASLLGYSIAKAAMNMTITKYAAELAPEGIKTLSLMPGWVNTDAAAAVTGDPAVRKFILDMFHKIDPNIEGPIEIEESIALQLKVINGLTEENSGKFLTQHGDDDTWF